MRQEAFESRHAPTWQKFEKWIVALSTPSYRAGSDDDTLTTIGRNFPAMYRKVCHHLAIARARRYSIGLQQRLNQLALDGHQHMYRTRTPVFTAIAWFLVRDFPAAVRRYWRYILTATALLYVPAFGMALAVALQPELIYSLIEPFDVAMFEEMYDPANDVLGRERESDTDIAMFGVYIYNNISIGFRTFAGGLLFGLGSLFFLIFNGLYFGAISSHLTSVGSTEPFWSFVAGHSSFELTAITIFGGVGLMIGYSAIVPGRRTRWQAIRHQAVAGMPLVYGGTLMLVIAAFVEAFWSSTTWPPFSMKLFVGISFWLLLGLYFLLLGKDES
jgi:uncharacterized membrane protein SpoIIM required for sporulation